MISEFTKTAVPQLVQHELEFSKNQHRDRFASLHEAESVIREELEELEEEVQACRGLFSLMHCYMRRNNVDCTMMSAADEMERRAKMAAMEAIQLAAMCSKLMEMDG